MIEEEKFYVQDKNVQFALDEPDLRKIRQEPSKSLDSRRLSAENQNSVELKDLDKPIFKSQREEVIDILEDGEEQKAPVERNSMMQKSEPMKVYVGKKVESVQIRSDCSFPFG